MNFRTTFTINPEVPKIDYNSRLLLLGSCFVDNIGEKLDYYQLQNLRNPFGILYHPAAIEKFIGRAISFSKYTLEDVFHHNEQWHSFDAHSSLSRENREELVKELNEQLYRTRNYLQNTSHVIITLGTAWGYTLEETGSFVANCHKLPQRRFGKKLMSLPEVTSSLRNIVNSILSYKPDAVIIFTVSPVRHIKDGMVENQVSKAHLLAAIYQLSAQFENGIKYFPAYEIMMDELRDYRFYGEDMIHPNATAVKYIWEKFTQSWFAPLVIPVMQEVEAVQKGLKHRPFNPKSTAHEDFLKRLYQKIENLKNDYPHLEFLRNN